MALVTGAAAGMGLATANAFAEAGAAVVLADFQEEAVHAAARKLIAAGHKAIAVCCDVSDKAQVEAMVERTVAELRLDAAFNNADAMAGIAPTADSTRDEWDRVVGINLRGVWSCMKYELRQMERQRSGAIVNNASVGALTGNPRIGSYIASKARRSRPDAHRGARVHPTRHPCECHQTRPDRHAGRARCRRRR